MTRSDFFKTLGHSIRGIERGERKRLLDYYEEIFDDKLESGQTEEEIISEFGGVSGLSTKILAEYPGTTSYRNPVLRVLSCVGLILLAPAIFGAAVALFSLVFSFFAASGALVLAGLLYIMFSLPVFALSAGVGVFQIGACLFCAGLGTVGFFGSVSFGRLSILFMKNVFRMYRCTFGKEAV